ncbi:MAG: aminopeptidase [Lachnospiraceae bacterium]|nr:aminopeptidase [Lachnospiraceae bacterium]
MMKLRYELAISRIREMMDEETVEEKFRDYFRTVGKFILLIDETNRKLKDGSFEKYSMEELKAWNTKLYEDILADTYNISYGNPAYAVEKLGAEYGSVLSALYAEIRGAISYVYEQNVEYLDILFELFIEVYNQFEGEPSIKNIKDTIYWYASDYCDVFVADRIIDQVDANRSFAADIIRQSDLTDLRYLYSFGEYISDSELRTARHLLELDESVIVKMADVYTEGYRIGFVNTGKDLSKKKTVNIRYVLGFERVVKKAIENFEKMGLSPVIYRSGVSMLTKRQHLKIGYYGAIANKQYEYDHRDDQALFLDKKFVERKLEVMQTTYERCKDLASVFAGPACIEMFGEEPFVPEVKEEVLTLSEKQRELSVSFDSRQSQMVNNYIPGDERSFTIIAYPVPEIGDKYEEIFDEIIRINTLDAKVYEKVQQTLIDALDQGTCVRILGGNGNHTDLTIQLHPLKDREKETIFENCVADVNIPVGEVFTSPVLEGTNGVLHVSKVYLNELQYQDLEITFANGMIADYNCKNFERELENKEYIQEHVLHRHATLPLGEFAIGTNTTAYVAAKKYGIEDKMPILIAEKMGPHFAVGDTCYSWSEDIQVYNPNGKEIIARDNSVSILRKEDVSKAYYHCHTDITIPYEELKSITVITKDGKEILLIENGEFVLSGTEILNEPLKNTYK